MCCVVLSRMALRLTSDGTCCSADLSSWMDSYLENTHPPVLPRCGPEHCSPLPTLAYSILCVILQCTANCATPGHELWWRGVGCAPAHIVQQEFDWSNAYVLGDGHKAQVAGRDQPAYQAAQSSSSQQRQSVDYQQRCGDPCCGCEAVGRSAGGRRR